MNCNQYSRVHVMWFNLDTVLTTNSEHGETGSVIHSSRDQYEDANFKPKLKAGSPAKKWKSTLNICI